MKIVRDSHDGSRMVHWCLGLAMVATPGVTIGVGCSSWGPWPIDAVASLASCSAPVIRQIGRLCTFHEWRCGSGSFEDWFDRWMRQQKEPVRVQKQLGQLILSGEQADQSWAIFWGIVPHESPGFAVLVSRLRAQPR